MEPHGKYTRPKIRFNELDRAHDGTAFRLATRHTGSTSERKKRDTNLPNGERETAAGPALSCSAAPRRHYLKWEERGGERPWRWSNEALPSCRVREFRPSAGERAPRGHALLRFRRFRVELVFRIFRILYSVFGRANFEKAGDENHDRIV